MFGFPSTLPHVAKQTIQYHLRGWGILVGFEPCESLEPSLLEVHKVLRLAFNSVTVVQPSLIRFNVFPQGASMTTSYSQYMIKSPLTCFVAIPAILLINTFQT